MLVAGGHLCRGDAGEAEHADLVSDVVPGERAAQALQVLAQQRAHRDDALRHALHLLVPPTPHNATREAHVSTKRQYILSFWLTASQCSHPCIVGHLCIVEMECHMPPFSTRSRHKSCIRESHRGRRWGVRRLASAGGKEERQNTHCCLRSSLPRISNTSRAPCRGGLEYIGRAIACTQPQPAAHYQSRTPSMQLLTKQWSRAPSLEKGSGHQVAAEHASLEAQRGHCCWDRRIRHWHEDCATAWHAYIENFCINETRSTSWGH